MNIATLQSIAAKQAARAGELAAVRTGITAIETALKSAGVGAFSALLDGGEIGIGWDGTTLAITLGLTNAATLQRVIDTADEWAAQVEAEL